MIAERLESAAGWVRHVITQPRDELQRWERAVRFAYDLVKSGAKQLAQDRAPQMAAALAFRTLFGLVPVLIVATVVIKGLQGASGVHRLALNVGVSLGLDRFQVLLDAEEGGQRSISVAQWLAELAEQAAAINLTAIGWIGFLVVIYAAIGLMGTIEASFNTVYRAHAGRSWAYRIPMYWTILTLGTALVGLSVYVDSRYDSWIGSFQAGEVLPVVLTWIWSFLITWVFLFILYRFVPNARVGTKVALLGALVAALLFEIGKRTLGALLENALSVRQLYGSLGLIPLFMIWVYLMWLVVLFGLEVASTLQALHGRRPDEVETKPPPSGVVEPAAILAVMQYVTTCFAEGRATSAHDLARTLRITERTLERMLERLAEAGLLHRVERGDDSGVTLARPPERIQAADVLRLGFDVVDDTLADAASPVVERLRAAQLREAEGLTLRDVMESSGDEVEPGACGPLADDTTGAASTAAPPATSGA